ncbi:MAG: hypothetical protein CMH87_06405 [Oceanibulbus sp.]|nr:hypothetical protein [Sulfitobacter sp.]
MRRRSEIKGFMLQLRKDARPAGREPSQCSGVCLDEGQSARPRKTPHHTFGTPDDRTVHA